MYIERVPNRNSPPAVLLRESFREGKRVRKRTVANLTRWPTHLVAAMEAALKGKGPVLGKLDDAFEIVRSLPHGHVAATLGSLRKCGLDRLIDPRRSRQRDLAMAMIVARVIDPRSKLATARGLGDETASTSLAETLDATDADEDDLYEAMDWLVEKQQAIETKLAKRHLSDGTLVLYDVTSSYYEGRTCPLIAYGHSRDGKKGKQQIVWGLLCNAQGCPVAVEVFEGNTSDPKTLGAQIQKVRQRFGLQRVVWVGDRGMITEARIREDFKPVEGLDWITALRAPAIRKLAEAGLVEPSLFDEQDLAEIHCPDYEAERLIACRNPLLTEERARHREQLLQATEKQLDKIVAATHRGQRALKCKDRIALRVGKVLNQYKVGKHFKLTITDDRFSYERDTQKIAAEAALDGIYIIRTSVPQEVMEAQEAVRAYKNLSVVERAFRSLKTVDLKVRPIYHRLANRVRAHVFLCMLAYYVEWHMRRAVAPILFDDDDKASAITQQSSPVAKAKRSNRAHQKAYQKRTDDDMPVHSFQTLLADLATIVKNRIRPKTNGAQTFDQLTRPTILQQRAFDLLGVVCRL